MIIVFKALRAPKDNLLCNTLYNQNIISNIEFLKLYFWLSLTVSMFVFLKFHASPVVAEISHFSYGYFFIMHQNKLVSSSRDNFEINEINKIQIFIQRKIFQKIL